MYIYIYVYKKLSNWPRGSSCELLGAPGENKLHIYIFINYIYGKQVSSG